MTSATSSSGLAKVIVIGEHAVVHGQPALAGAIARRVTCAFGEASGPLRLRCPAWDLEVSGGDDHPVSRALDIIAGNVGHRAGGLIDVDAEIPARAGLGSSAALCVALTRLLSGSSKSDEHTIAIANLGEACFHSNPSGIDVALAARGGLGLFRRDQGLEPIANVHFEIAVGLSGEVRNTSALVRAVAERKLAEPAKTDATLTRLGQLAVRAADSLREFRSEEVGPLLGDAHRLLSTLGLSTPTLDGLIDTAAAVGATGAKLTGAGGGGAVIAVGPDLDAIVAAWREAGFDGFTTVVGAQP